MDTWRGQRNSLGFQDSNLINFDLYKYFMWYHSNFEVILMEESIFPLFYQSANGFYVIDKKINCWVQSVCSSLKQRKNKGFYNPEQHIFLICLVTARAHTLCILSATHQNTKLAYAVEKTVFASHRIAKFPAESHSVQCASANHRASLKSSKSAISSPQMTGIYGPSLWMLVVGVWTEHRQDWLEAQTLHGLLLYSHYLGRTGTSLTPWENMLFYITRSIITGLKHTQPSFNVEKL